MDKYSYRNHTGLIETIPEAPVQQWRELAREAELRALHSRRLHNEPNSVDTQIDKLTQDWTQAEREQFRYWYRNTRDQGSLMKANLQEKTIYAQYAPYGSDMEVAEFKKQRKSIIRRIRRLQNELSEMFDTSQRYVDWSGTRFSTPEEKLEAIQSALNQICVLLSTLKTKELVQASLVRTQRQLHAIEPKAASLFKKAASVSSQQMTRIAQSAEITDLAKMIKSELDQFHYGTHLRRFFKIYDTLINLGFVALASDMETVIEKELGNLNGIYKKLGEVYSELLKIPAEQLSEVAPKEKEQRVPMQDRFETVEEKPQEIEAQ